MSPVAKLKAQEPKVRSPKPATKPTTKALSHPEITAIIVGIMLAMFLGALDQTIGATALPTIGRHFGDLEQLD